MTTDRPPAPPSPPHAAADAGAAASGIPDGDRPGGAAGRLTSSLWLCALLLLVGLGWCAGTGRWTAASWQVPLQYLDGFYTDILTTLTTMKAARDGSVVMLWKIIPELGAPFDGNWNDWPSNEELTLAVLGALARVLDIYAGLNAALLLGHLAAAGVFFGVARHLGCSRPWAFVASFAYGLAPFIFMQSPHHIGVAWVWHVPLFVLVWTWVASDGGLVAGTRRFRAALAIGALVGLMNVYYANIFCQLTLLGAAASAVRGRSWAPLKGAAAVVASVAVAFALGNLDTWTYSAVHGRNPGAFSRDYRWLEIYGLKLVDLFIPPVNHHVEPLAELGRAHRAASMLQDEGSYLGLIGIAALALLAVTFALTVARRRGDAPPAEGWQVLWIILYGTTGGLNALVGAAGFTLFRTGCRYSVIILAIALLYAARRLTALERARGGGPPMDARTTVLAAGVLVAIIALDQIPPTPAPEMIHEVAAQVSADRDFVRRMEEALPRGALVFQLPVMDFPEAPVPGLSSYEHLRPYIHSTHLRFSFGSTKGRPRDQWQRGIAGLPLDERVGQLKARGFSAIYINRAGFPDGGAQLINDLRALGLTKPLIESAAGDLVCVRID